LCKSETCARCLQSGEGTLTTLCQLIQLGVAQTDTAWRLPGLQACKLKGAHFCVAFTIITTTLRLSAAVRCCMCCCDVITHQLWAATIHPSDVLVPTVFPRSTPWARVLVVMVAAMTNNTCAVRASAVGRMAPSGAVRARRCVHKIVMECGQLGSIETHSISSTVALLPHLFWQAAHWTAHCHTVQSVHALPPRFLQLMSVLCVHRLWGERR
jgi:hypothetical protein